METTGVLQELSKEIESLSGRKESQRLNQRGFIPDKRGNERFPGELLRNPRPFIGIRH